MPEGPTQEYVETLGKAEISPTQPFRHGDPSQEDALLKGPPTSCTNAEPIDVPSQSPLSATQAREEVAKIEAACGKEGEGDKVPSPPRKAARPT